MRISTASWVPLLKRGVASRKWGMRTATTAGPSFEYRQPSGDDPKLRKTCTSCGFVQYENPKIVCGSVLTVQDGGRGSAATSPVVDGISHEGSEDLYVLGRRNIQPRRGFWGIPAGFLESGETSEQGAAREAREEINADVAVGGLLAVYSLPHIDQVQMIYASVLKSAQQVDGKFVAGSVSAGQETDEVMLVRWEDIPWDVLAFPTTSWALWHHRIRTEEAAAASAFDTSPGGLLTTTNTLKEGAATEIKADARGHPSHPQFGPRGVSREGVGVSQGTVYSAPAADISLFWSPGRGLHKKEGWNVSVDS